MMASAVVVLPEPLSPTTPKVLPAGIVKLTPSTAWTSVAPLAKSFFLPPK
nr:hypothetical protein [uncultured Brevundimonas sp.]